MTQHAFGRRPATIVDPGRRDVPEVGKSRKKKNSVIRRLRRNIVTIVSGAALTFALAIFLAFDGATASVNAVQIVASGM